MITKQRLIIYIWSNIASNRNQQLKRLNFYYAIKTYVENAF